ncbi:MAG: hypothetical protein K0R06_3563, partial [Clostridium sp.]
MVCNIGLEHSLYCGWIYCTNNCAAVYQCHSYGIDIISRASIFSYICICIFRRNFILLEEFDFLDVQSFLVGNIGPDSGVPNEDWSEFSPPKVISHWYDKAGRIDSEDFRVKYLSDTSKYTAIEKSFYLGYYTHLLSDIEWG